MLKWPFSGFKFIKHSTISKQKTTGESGSFAKHFLLYRRSTNVGFSKENVSFHFHLMQCILLNYRHYFPLRAIKSCLTGCSIYKVNLVLTLNTFYWWKHKVGHWKLIISVMLDNNIKHCSKVTQTRLQVFRSVLSALLWLKQRTSDILSDCRI